MAVEVGRCKITRWRRAMLTSLGDKVASKRKELVVRSS